MRQVEVSAVPPQHHESSELFDGADLPGPLARLLRRLSLVSLTGFSLLPSPRPHLYRRVDAHGLLVAGPRFGTRKKNVGEKNVLKKERTEGGSVCGRGIERCAVPCVTFTVTPTVYRRQKAATSCHVMCFCPPRLEYAPLRLALKHTTDEIAAVNPATAAVAPPTDGEIRQ